MFAGLNFHGLSTPDDLIEMWRELKHDDDNKDMNVIFEYVEPEQLKEGFNIINIKYNPEIPNETGHYVLVTNFKNYKEFFDPIAENTINEIDKINEIAKHIQDDKEHSSLDQRDKDILISLEGKQKYGNSDCGYHCLTHALNIYNDESKIGGKLPANPTKQDILLDILKLNRAIYYQLKNIADNKAISTNIKKSMIQAPKGKGLSDDIKPDILKSMSYNQLKELVEM